MEREIIKAATLIHNSKNLAAFTGAGISAESGIPTFRGEDGIWKKYNPQVLELNFFYSNPEKSWEVIAKLFYDHLQDARPNDAHYALAAIEKEKGNLTIVTQNIDHFHQLAGSKDVVEFHGTTAELICQKCDITLPASSNMKQIPPRCPSCNSILKPNFVFFGEGIPHEAFMRSSKAAHSCDVMIVVGTSGEVMPANMIPVEAKKNGAKIIEINPDKKVFAYGENDVYINHKAVFALTSILEELKKLS